ncbi:rab-GTPase-TBC domain-containing protein [Gymnopilus junonius]|uniref:Rab-GTPase-TBC domain-containing protein n=1 Tax=Gymnopilus junonius TaxID=109634 RepID=A0A9P5P2D6_GYMJU|nr:rab-GTPase-TBC domain-containing protein [Gymnopilus junonius]
MVSHTPTPLDLPKFDDDDDAFDTKEIESLPYVFSPDAIREEMAKKMALEPESWAEGETSSNVSFADHNASVSTLDIGPRAFHDSGKAQSDFPDSLNSSISLQFTQISLSTPDDEHPPQRIVHTDEILSPNAPSDLSSAGTSKAFLEGNSQASPLPSTHQQHETSPETYTTSLATPKSAPLPDPYRRSDDSLPSPPNSTSGSSSQATTSFELPPMSATTDNAPAPSLLLTEKPRTNRPHRSNGPSAFEKVRSKTRPAFLPPKPKQEDEKHMADWQQMMRQSRTLAEKRRKAFQERRLAREKAIEDSFHIWEKEILPDWRIVHRQPELRKLWWRGIPTKLRSVLWEKAVGNELALSKGRLQLIDDYHYRTCLSRAKRALSSGVFPQHTLDLIERDIETTLPAIHIFNKENGPMYADLKDMLCAWVVSRSDEGLGYAIGAAKVAAMLSINMPNQQGFIVMRNLLERHCLRSFFGGERSKDDVEAYYRIFDTLLADGMPKIYFNFKQHQIAPGAYLPDWVVPLFLDHLPFEACARIWDVLLLEGDSFLYRASLGILAVLEPRLFFPDKRELLELLKGENKAAIEVAKREGQSLMGGRYEIYGVDEETLWDRIDSMEDWWKENTWTRLIQRELPDL